MLRYVFFSVLTLLLLTACGGTDLDRLIKTRECVKCDLSGAYLYEANLARANLYEANLTRSDLTGANLTGTDLIEADLTGAILDDVIGADFRGALNVPPKYLKD